MSAPLIWDFLNTKGDIRKGRSHKQELRDPNLSDHNKGGMRTKIDESHKMVECRIFYSRMIFWSRTLSNGILRRREKQSMWRPKSDRQVITETQRNQLHQLHWTAIKELWADGTLQLIRMQSWLSRMLEGNWWVFANGAMCRGEREEE